MNSITFDVREAKYPVKEINDRLFKALDLAGPVEIRIFGFPLALGLDLKVPLQKAQSPLTRILIRKIELRGGKVWAAYQ
jgi:hypothetical protein